MNYYGLYYFFHYAFHAVAIVYLPVHCKNIGFSPFEVAVVASAVYLAISFTSPYFLHISKSKINAGTLALVSSLISLGVFYFAFSLSSFLLFTFVFFVVCVLCKGVLAVIEAKAIRDTEEQKGKFQLIRRWGSIGFIVCLYIVGSIIDSSGWRNILPAGLVALLFTAISVFPLKKSLRDSNIVGSNAESEGKFVWTPQFVTLLIIQCLVWFAHAPLYVYLSIYLQELGWTASDISLAWNVGVLAEILFFTLSYIIEQRFSLYTILRVGILLSVLRWFLLATVTSPTAILLSQLLHAASFAATYLCTAKLTFRMLADADRDKGQGYLIAGGMGIGSLSGRFAFGYAASFLGSYKEANLLFYGAALIAFIAFLVSLRLNKILKEG